MIRRSKSLSSRVAFAWMRTAAFQASVNKHLWVGLVQPQLHMRATIPVQAEIVDETDIYEDVNRRVLRRGGTRADVATFLTMFEHKLHASALSPAEVAAVAAFLQLNVEEFAPLMRYDLPLKV